MSLVKVRERLEDKQSEARRTLALRFNDFLKATGVSTDRIIGLCYDDGEYRVFVKEEQVSQIKQDGSFNGGVHFLPSSSYVYMKSWNHHWAGVYLSVRVSNEGVCETAIEEVGHRLQKVDRYFWRLFRKPGASYLSLPEKADKALK